VQRRALLADSAAGSLSPPQAQMFCAAQDFFANSTEGAKARGEPPPKKPKTAEEQVHGAFWLAMPRGWRSRAGG
jgi:hypothetical protein